MEIDNLGFSPCKQCGERKHYTNFYKNDRTCKDCRKARVRANRAAKLEYYREYDRQRYRKAKSEQSEDFFNKYRREQTAEKRQEVTQRWRESNRYKVNAHARVGIALSNGALARPKSCEVCLCRCTPEAHHSDYRKPLEVHWLCTKCHGLVHSTLNYVRRYFGAEAHHILPEVLYGS